MKGSTIMKELNSMISYTPNTCVTFNFLHYSYLLFIYWVPPEGACDWRWGGMWVTIVNERRPCDSRPHSFVAQPTASITHYPRSFRREASAWRVRNVSVTGTRRRHEKKRVWVDHIINYFSFIIHPFFCYATREDRRATHIHKARHAWPLERQV